MLARSRLVGYSCFLMMERLQLSWRLLYGCKVSLLIASGGECRRCFKIAKAVAVGRGMIGYW